MNDDIKCEKKTTKLLQLFFNLLISLPITSQLQNRLSDTSCIEDQVIFVEVVTIYYFAAYQFAEIRINGTETLPQILIFPLFVELSLNWEDKWLFELGGFSFGSEFFFIGTCLLTISIIIYPWPKLKRPQGHHHFTWLSSPTSCNFSLSTESNYIMVTNT